MSWRNTARPPVFEKISNFFSLFCATYVKYQKTGTFDYSGEFSLFKWLIEQWHPAAFPQRSSRVFSTAREKIAIAAEANVWGKCHWGNMLIGISFYPSPTSGLGSMAGKYMSCSSWSLAQCIRLRTTLTLLQCKGFHVALRHWGGVAVQCKGANPERFRLS